MSERLIALAQAAVDAYEDRFESLEGSGNYTGPIDEEMKALAAALSQPHDSEQGAAPDAQLLFDFGGFLTSSERQWVFSSRDDAAPMVDAIRAFAAKRGIDLDAPHAPAPVCADCKGTGLVVDWVRDENDRSGQSDFKQEIECPTCTPAPVQAAPTEPQGEAK